MFKEINIYKIFKSVVDVMIIVLSIILCIKKGGFYTSDIKFYVIGLYIIFIIYTVFETIHVIKNKINKVGKINFEQILMILLSISYFLPIIFGVCINKEDSVWEMIRYSCIPMLFFIVSKSDNKKIYVYSLISFGIIQCFLGIDGISSRLLSPYLAYIRSGYLSRDLDRLSGTIQYANTCGIIISISTILLFGILEKIGQKILNNDCISKISNNKSIYYSIFSLTVLGTICIILTKSRMVILIYMLAIIYIAFKKDISMKVCIISNVILSLLASSNISSLILNNSSKIYFVTLCYLILSVIVSDYIIKLVIFNKDLKSKKDNHIKKAIFITIFLIVTVMYLIIAFNVPNNIILNSNDKVSTISREIYNISKGDNLISLDVDGNNSNDFEIYIIKEDYEYNQEIIQSFKDESNISFKFNNNGDIKRIIIKAECKSGKIIINNCMINNEKVILEYKLLPTDIIFRIKDVIHGSTTNRDRTEYAKDAIKIWRKSPIIGLGGEAFKYSYKEVQTLKYTSSEVHNSYLQILVESGALGFILIICIVIVNLTKKSNMYIKVIFIMLAVHNIFDLNFSYLISIIIFGIICSINNNNVKESEINNGK